MTSSNETPFSARESLTFIGLGVMGYSMAGHLARAGHSVTVFNRSAAKADQWVAEFGGVSAASVRSAVSEASVVFSCVGNDEDLRRVTLGPLTPAGRHGGGFDVMSPGTVWVDHTTTSAEVARELHAAARERGLFFVDAPVSGGSRGAVAGELTVLCGGDKHILERLEPLMRLYAKTITDLGGPGSGQLAKMVNQICIAGALQGLAEAMNFGKKAGLEMPRVLQAISQGAAQSWQLDHRGKYMVIESEAPCHFAIEWLHKDLTIALDEAGAIGINLPLTNLVSGALEEIKQQGGARWDTSSLIKCLN